MTPLRPAVLAVLAAALAFPAPASALVTPASTAPPRQQLRLVLPLVGDQAGLARFAEAVSSPDSRQYGRYRSTAWLARRFGASLGARLRVVAYLRAHGARDVRADASGQLVFARIAVASAERLFGTSLSDQRLAHAARRQR